MKTKLVLLCLLLFAIAIPAMAGPKDKPLKNIYVDLPAASLSDPGQIVIITREVVVDFACIPAPGNPPTGLVRLYCDSGTGNLTCLTSTGTSCLAGGGGATTFDLIGSGTNITAAMLVGTGASLGPTGSGTITATSAPFSGLTGSLLLAQTPLTTVGDTLSVAAGPVLTRVPNGITGSVYTATNAAVPAFISPGLAGRSIAGTTDTILCDSGTAIRDRASTEQYTSGSAVAVTLPQAGSSGCANNFVTKVFPTGAGAVTVTPTTSTINGQATLVPSQNTNCLISSPDNANYIAECGNWVKAGTNLGAVFNADGSTTFNLAAALSGTTLPINGVISATGAIATIADANFPLTLTCAQTTDAQDCVGINEASAATNGTLTNGLANQAQLEVSTATNSTATPLEVAQGSITNTVATPLAQFESTWNNASLTAKGVVISITNTSSNANSLAFQIFGGASGTTNEFNVSATGTTTTNGALSLAGNISQSTTTSSMTVQSGSDGSFVTGGTLTLRGADDTNNAASNTAGLVVIRGGNETGASGATESGGTVSITGGNINSTATTGTAGPVNISGGACVNVASASTCNAIVKINQPYFTTGTANANDLACRTAANTYASCSGTTTGTFVGVIDSVSTDTVFITSTGVGGTHIFNATSATFTSGDYVCQSTVAANLVIDNSTTSCPLGTGIGIYAGTTGTQTAPVVTMATNDGATVPINQVTSATGAIATLADGNNPLTINCALTSGTTCLTTGETTAATTAGAVEDQITTLTTSTAIPLQITQGANGPAAANAPAVLNVSAAAAGGLAGASQSGFTGAPLTLKTGAGSAGGATTGNGGTGGGFSLTMGAGGAAGGNTANSGGVGGGMSVTPGAGVAGAATGAGGAAGASTFAAASGGAGGATSGTGGAGSDFLVTTGTGGAATAGSTTGRGGNATFTLGSAGGTGTAGAPGQFNMAFGTEGGSQTGPFLNITGTWNTTGAPDAAIFANITNTASALGGAILDTQLGGTGFFKLATQSATPATAAADGPNLVLGGSLPEITTPGTTPYLNMNTLVKGALNTCTFALTTSTFTLALSPVSLCTYTLPNAALTWYWSCTAGWSNNAGTTPTFAVGVKWGQAPSVAFNMADIYTTNAGVGTEGTTSTTTNSNILATGTLTPGATVFQTQFSGTFTASATSGTFTPTVSLTGTSATGTMTGGCTVQ